MFHQPAGGWQGMVHETATLTAGATASDLYSVAASGNTVVAGADRFSSGSPQGIVYVFVQPSRGWQTGTRPSAEFEFNIGPYDQAPSVAVSGSRVGASELHGGMDPCPCGDSVYTFNRPPSGWSSYSAFLSQPTVSGSESGVNELAINPPYYFVGGIGSVTVDAASAVPIPPSASRVSASGIAHGKPRIGFSLSGGANSPAMRSFSVTLPQGLHFSSGNVQISNAGRYAVRLTGQTLVVTLKSPSSHANVLLNPPVLLEDRSLRNRVLRLIKANRRTHHKQSLTLSMELRATDTTGTATRFLANLSAR